MSAGDRRASHPWASHLAIQSQRAATPGGPLHSCPAERKSLLRGISRNGWHPSVDPTTEPIPRTEPRPTYFSRPTEYVIGSTLWLVQRWRTTAGHFIVGAFLPKLSFSAVVLVAFGWHGRLRAQAGTPRTRLTAANYPPGWPYGASPRHPATQCGRSAGPSPAFGARAGIAT